MPMRERQQGGTAGRNQRAVCGGKCTSIGSRNWLKRREHSPGTMDLTSCSMWVSQERGRWLHRRTGRTARRSVVMSGRPGLRYVADSARNIGGTPGGIARAAMSVNGEEEIC